MSRKPYFKNIPQWGNLYLDYIFHYDDLPILFSLRDKKGGFYLCVCYELYVSQKWFITKTDFKNLKNMNDNQITVRDLFLKNSYIVEAIKKQELKDNYQFLESNSIDFELLPEKDFVLETDEEEQTKFNEYYHDLINVNTDFEMTRVTIYINTLLEKNIKRYTPIRLGNFLIEQEKWPLKIKSFNVIRQ